MNPLLLWDIDGTLLDSNEVGHELYAEASHRAVGRRLERSSTAIHGLTDWINSRNMLSDAGIAGRELESATARMLAAIPEILEEMIASGRFEPVLLPGVGEVLRATAGAGGVNTLLTGNVVRSAQLKMKSAGLEEYFDFDIGGYAADAPEREDLLPVALERAGRKGIEGSPANAWIIGDTPHDYAVAEAHGAHCLLVATGKYSLDELVPLGADAVLDGLADTDLVLKTLGLAE